MEYKQMLIRIVYQFKGPPGNSAVNIKKEKRWGSPEERKRLDLLRPIVGAGFEPGYLLAAPAFTTEPGMTFINDILVQRFRRERVRPDGLCAVIFEGILHDGRWSPQMTKIVVCSCYRREGNRGSRCHLHRLSEELRGERAFHRGIGGEREKGLSAR
jgi:hypothetical protein